MKIKPLPSRETILTFLQYDPDTGIFKRATNVSQMRIGDIAGNIGQTGYVYIQLCGKSYTAHRLAWKAMTGLDPACQIDHKNGIRHDNRFENLRESNQSQNVLNSKPRACNSSGRKGVSWCGVMRKWRARIMINYKEIRLGYFDDIDDAAEAYRQGSLTLAGQFSVFASRPQT